MLLDFKVFVKYVLGCLNFFFLRFSSKDRSALFFLLLSQRNLYFFFLARLASTVGVASLNDFTVRTNFNCFTPFFHRTTSFLTSTTGNAECRARCQLSCEQSGETENNVCQYFTMYGTRCITGNLENVPSSTAPLTNPFVKDTNAFNGFNPNVPIWFKNRMRKKLLSSVLPYPQSVTFTFIIFFKNCHPEKSGKKLMLFIF